MGGDKLHKIANTTFTIKDCYKELKVIGQGSYGVVCSALDTSQGKMVAIKKITPMAKHVSDAKHVLREIRLMRHMGKHENIISLEDLMVQDQADELYIVMELMDSDLHRVIQSPQTLTDSHHRHFMHQLLCGVKYLHDNRIIHRDLKPGNLLVSRECKLRITDFGLARQKAVSYKDNGTNGEIEPIDEPMTEHVVTRWYRAPELMLCPDGLYTYAVDMWSCGCILGELLRRRPVFPGKNFIEQLSLIFDVIGAPSPEDIAHIRNLQAMKFLESQSQKRKRPLTSVFAEAPSGALGLMDSLLRFSAEQRLTVDDALHSTFFQPISASSLIQPSLLFPDVSPEFEFEFENENLSKFQLKQLIMEEVKRCKASHTQNTLSETENNRKSERTSSAQTSRRPSGSSILTEKDSKIPAEGSAALTAQYNESGRNDEIRVDAKPQSGSQTGSKPSHTIDRSAAGSRFGMRPVSGIRGRTASSSAARGTMDASGGVVRNGSTASTGSGGGASGIASTMIKNTNEINRRNISSARGDVRKESSEEGKGAVRYGVNPYEDNTAQRESAVAAAMSPARANKTAIQLLERAGGQAMEYLSPSREKQKLARQRQQQQKQQSGQMFREIENYLHENMDYGPAQYSGSEQQDGDEDIDNDGDDDLSDHNYIEQMPMGVIGSRINRNNFDIGEQLQNVRLARDNVSPSSQSKSSTITGTVTGRRSNPSQVLSGRRDSITSSTITTARNVKKPLTVPVSPKFSRSSRETRRYTEQGSNREGARPTSAMRSRGGSNPAKEPTGGTQAPEKIDEKKRSMSASRLGGRNLSATERGNNPVQRREDAYGTSTTQIPNHKGNRYDDSNLARTNPHVKPHNLQNNCSNAIGKGAANPGVQREKYHHQPQADEDKQKKKWEILELETRLKVEQDKLRRLSKTSRQFIS